MYYDVIMSLEKKMAQNGMIPLSYFQGLINSRGMNHYFSPVKVSALRVRDFSKAWRQQLGIFALSYLPAFLIRIPTPVFFPNWVQS